MKIVTILLPVALDQAYHYSAPENMMLQPGDIVQVPFGKKSALGCVWDEDLAPPPAKLKAVEALIKPHILPLPARKTIDWMAKYTLNPRGQFLRMCIREEYVDEVQARVDYSTLTFTLQEPEGQRLTPQRLAAIHLLRQQAHWTREEILATGIISPAQMLALIKAGILMASDDAPEYSGLNEPAETLPLNADQAAAADRLTDSVNHKKFECFLLDGITGSGKTEVYCEAVEAALRTSQQALVMLPEIALTHSLLARFQKRFGDQVHLWHSGLPLKKRRATWQHIADGKPAIVLGARSALFLPFQNLRLIVVDEEHDSSYKQEEGLSHNARDMAIVRARFEQIPIVLASATPSLESFHNAQTGKYTWLKLNHRATGAALPNIQLLDMKPYKLPHGEWISPLLLEAVKSTLEAGAQSLLFLNRRGYAPLMLCRGCGHKMECPSCTAWLVEHRRKQALACHHCGFEAPMPHSCPSCLAAADFVSCGPGVERIYEEIKHKLPDAKCVMLSSDTLQQQEILQGIAQNKYNIIVGTQIMAKGHDFPHLGLVGVVDGDLGLSTIDLRAAERTFQVLQQVTGRAGRHESSAGQGKAIIQTYVPEHPLMQALAANDRDAFYQAELTHRERGLWPPFGRLALIMISTPRDISPAPFAQALLRAAPHMENIKILGPAEPSIAILRDRKRLMLTLHAPKQVDLSGYIRQWLHGLKFPHIVKLRVDVDPLGFG